MEVIVQKFGGSSLARPGDFRCCARTAVDAFRRGDRVAVVVSAMGSTTDDLLDLARTVGGPAGERSSRELDQLLATGEQVSMALMTMALRAEGLDALGLSANELGLVTDKIHGNARIRALEIGHVRRAIEHGRVPVIAGFQGVAPNGEITTLGRGGSDATAVAVAAGLQEDEPPGGVRCEIYTDVDGVYTADPRLVPTARRLERIGHDDLLELACLGVDVVQAKAAQLAKEHGVTVIVRRSESRGGGGGATLVDAGPSSNTPAVTGFALRLAERAIVSLVGERLGERRELIAQLGELLRAQGIDLIDAETGPRSLSLIVSLDEAVTALRQVHGAMRDSVSPAHARIELKGKTPVTEAPGI